MLEKKRSKRPSAAANILCDHCTEVHTHVLFQGLACMPDWKKAMILNSLQGCEYLYYVCKAFLRRENSGKFWSWSISETRFSYPRSLCIRTKSSKKVASRSSTLNNDEFSFCRMAKELSLDWFHGALLAPGRSYLVSTPTLQITSLGLKASWTDFIILYYIHKNYLLILIKAQNSII